MRVLPDGELTGSPDCRLSHSNRRFIMMRQPRTRLHMDVLESRIALAGDVSALLSGQDLSLFGDSLGNEIRLSQATNGNVTVTGLNGTTVNGRPSVTFTRPNLIKTEVFLNEGNDRLVIAGAAGYTVTNDLNIELGQGSDILSFSNARIGANLGVKGDSGFDRVTATGLRVGTDAYFEMGQDASNVSLSSSTIGQNLTLIGDAAADVFSLSGVTLGGDLNLETKEGADRITVTTLNTRSVIVNTDLGADIVTLTSVTSTEDIKVNTGKDNDTLRLDRVNSGKSLIVEVDDGNDTVTAVTTRATVDAIFVGGAGIDTLTNRGITGGVKREIKEFERLL
jgi:hypothetical protein